MRAVCLMRRTWDPRELSSLRVVDNRLVAERMHLVKNEGDVRAVQLVKATGMPFDALCVGELDDITRIHLFVYGAREVWEVGESRSHLLREPEVARIVAAQVRRLDDVQLVALGGMEQDTGRRMLPGLLAAALGWELFTSVLSLRVDDARACLTQATDGGTQEVDVALPVCVAADDSCGLGRDPSDEYDLIEKLEKRSARKVTATELGLAPREAALSALSAPPERQAQPVVASGPEVVARVAELIRRVQS
jgi:electron transfer flavoprotein alpha/beta subunit